MSAEAGREVWAQLLRRITDSTDRDAELFMHWIIESVVIDVINNRIMRDEAFAQSLGERIQKLFDAEQSRRPPDLSA